MGNKTLAKRTGSNVYLIVRYEGAWATRHESSKGHFHKVVGKGGKLYVGKWDSLAEIKAYLVGRGYVPALRVSSCIVERRILVRQTTLNLATGGFFAEQEEWITRPCGGELQPLGEALCRTCTAGWQCDENAPTPTGAKTITELKAATNGSL